MAEHFRLHGARQLEKALRELPNTISKNVITRSLKEAAQPIADKAIANAPVGEDSGHPGRIRQRIHVSTQLTKSQRKKRVRNKGEATVYIGVGKTVTEAITEEFGSGPRYTKAGKFAGQVAAAPFLRPAWNAGKMAALSDLERALWKRIAKAAARAARRARGKS